MHVLKGQELQQVVKKINGETKLIVAPNKGAAIHNDMYTHKANYSYRYYP